VAEELSVEGEDPDVALGDEDRTRVRSCRRLTATW
jgi:hypothetical protein